MRRRAFITLLGSTAATWPLAARAQQATTPTIGFLGSESPTRWENRLRAFRQGLSETGYAEGSNLAIEFRWADGHNDRLPALAADLVRRQVTMIFAPGSTPAALAAKTATAAIPIVFTIGTDPVATGLVASLARPSGNVTGVTVLAGELGPKKLELLHQLVPGANAVGLLVNPTNPAAAEPVKKELQAAARALGLQLHMLLASTESDFDTVFANQVIAAGLVIGPDQFFISRSEQLGALTVRHAVPTIFQTREFAAAGGLMSYGGSLADADRLAGIYAGRILKGEKPVDLPVQQSTKVELFINTKTAKTLGLTVPPALLATADEVIE